MRVVIAPDSFKGTLSAADAARAMASGVKKADKRIETSIVPMADGGEGTIDVWMNHHGGRLTTLTVTNPMGQAVQAAYLTLPGRKVVIELAAASGLTHVPDGQRTNQNALAATTFGTGEIIVRALEQGAEVVVIGLGGSATSDGGYGLLRALGAIYYDENGLVLDGKDATQLARLKEIDVKGIHPRFYEAEFILACDVTNPLCGDQGAASVFGPQKGLSVAGIAERDSQLQKFAKLLQDAFNVSRPLEKVESSGAAGGAGVPLLVNTKTRIEPGAVLVGQALDLERQISEADWVMTGEGRTDGQSVKGKVPGYIASLAERYNKPCVVVSGSFGSGHELLFDQGVTHMIAATPEGADKRAVKEHAGEWVQAAAYHATLDMTRQQR